MSLIFIRCFRKDALPPRKRETLPRHVSRDPKKTADQTASIRSLTSAPNAQHPITATDVSPRTNSIYPQQFQATVNGRSKRALGNHFELQNFGVNHTTLAPGAASALQHHHSKQDELVYILEGTATVRLGSDEIEMKSGTCIGFPAGQGVGHCIVNKSNENVVYLEIGDRAKRDEVDYPEVDLKCIEKNGKWEFLHKDGTLYDK